MSQVRHVVRNLIHFPIAISSKSRSTMATATQASQMKMKLGDGHDIPAVGFGTYQVGDAEVEPAITLALRLGYRHIDTAEGYRNEEGVGRAIKNSGIPREDIFVTTKVFPGNPDWGQPAKTYDETLAALKESVRKLQLDQVDLFLIHAPFADEQGRQAQYRALVEGQRLGLCRSIGVSNFNTKHLEELRDAGLPQPAANQIELHPLHQPQVLLDYMQHNGILAIAYSSLAPLSNWREGYIKEAGNKVLGEPSPIAEIAERVGVTESRLLLRYAIQKGWPVLPKSTREERMVENLDLDFSIPDAEIEALDALPQRKPAAWGQQDAPFDPLE